MSDKPETDSKYLPFCKHLTSYDQDGKGNNIRGYMLNAINRCPWCDLTAANATAERYRIALEVLNKAAQNVIEREYSRMGSRNASWLTAPYRRLAQAAGLIHIPKGKALAGNDREKTQHEKDSDELLDSWGPSA